MKVPRSLEILADNVSEGIKKGADFGTAFFAHYPRSGYFEHEKWIVMSRVGKILNWRRQLERMRTSQPLAPPPLPPKPPQPEQMQLGVSVHLYPD